ncbi:MAG: endonuclease/exonuclease/phosphatase family protein [Polyangiaceae bacterium]|nr:endonuclease/exonuclease/phosphatase family protein [Polyangiaceae bacterium]
MTREAARRSTSGAADESMHAIVRGARRVGAHASVRLALLGALVGVACAACASPEAAAPARAIEVPLLVGATCGAGDGCLIIGCNKPDPDCHLPTDGGAGGGHTGGGQGGGATGPTFRALTYNVHHAEDPSGNIELDDVVARLDQAAPHVACLQEVDKNASRSNYVDQASYLASHADNLPYYFYAPVGTYAEISVPPYSVDEPDLVDLYEDTIGVAGYRGIAVLSRYPILATYEWSFGGDFQPRSIVVFAVDSPDLGLVLGLCTHLPTGPEGDPARAEMIGWIEDNALLGLPTLLMGDLNARHTWGEIDDLEADWETATPAAVFTHPAGAPTKQFDYVMSRNLDAVDVDATIVSGTQPSDHLPLLATYRLP